MKRLLRKLRVLKNKQGVTLTELIVAMVVFSIITMSVASVFAPMLSVYNKANDLAETNTLLDNLSEELISDLADAYAVNLSGGTLSITPRKNAMPFNYNVPQSGEYEGLLCKNGTPIRDAAFYKGKTVSVSYHGTDQDRTPLSAGAVSGAFYVRIEIFRDGTEMASRDYAVSPLSLQ